MSKRKVNQEKVNAMVLDILEDIVGLSGVYCFDLAKKVEKLNLYLAQLQQTKSAPKGKKG